ncbi:MAG TPA: hypothetical protein VGT40_12170 [Methylomirabilota bacterium]|jgi:hypothetical protein|nr:hypothetical protein [Methylomirabilota bacterium]
MPEKVHAVSAQSQQFSTELSWDNIEEPGAYVDATSGELYRIPQEALLPGSSPLIRKESARPSKLVQLSKSPFITTFQARMLACEHDVQPNF